MSAGGGATGLQRQSGRGVVVMPVRETIHRLSLRYSVLLGTWYRYNSCWNCLAFYVAVVSRGEAAMRRSSCLRCNLGVKGVPYVPASSISSWASNIPAYHYAAELVSSTWAAECRVNQA